MNLNNNVRLGRSPKIPRIPAFLTAFFLLTSPAPGSAADTAETWEAGAFDFEFFLSGSGLGLDRPERSGVMSALAGYGIRERLSAYIEAHEDFQNVSPKRSTGVSVGIFGTPVSGNHWELDLFLDLGMDTGEGTELTVNPALELNYDHTPDQGSWGTYFRAGAPVDGLRLSRLRRHEAPSSETSFLIEAAFGSYLTAAPGHQVFLEIDAARHFHKDEQRFEIGGVAAGYNRVLNEIFELVSQAIVDIPQKDERWNGGFTFGFIATLPSAP